MALIDVVRWDNATPDIYAWKFPEDNLSTLTQLIVNESQEAVLFSKGEILGKFGPGKHTLKTENLPLLRKLYGIPFGGENPFTAEVWFVNKTIALDVKWGTPTPIQLLDPTYKIMVPVRAFGQFGVQIADAEKFLVKLVGTLTDFDKETLSRYFKGILLRHATDKISEVIVREKINILEINTQVHEVSEFLHNGMNPEFNEFGVNIVSFNVTNINVSEDHPSVKKLQEVLARKMEMDTLGFTYQEERSYDVMEGAAKNEGTAGGVMGAGIGLGMGFGVGGGIGNMMGGMVNPNIMNPNQPGGGGGTGAVGGQTQQNPPTINCPHCNAAVMVGSKFCGSCGKPTEQKETIDSNKTMVACDKCGEMFQSTVKFCPKCGDPYNPCPSCGNDNPVGVTNCTKCNAALPIDCPDCSTKVYADAKFCPNCGKSMKLACPKCNNEVKPDTKFCGNCGQNLTESPQ